MDSIQYLRKGALTPTTVPSLMLANRSMINLEKTSVYTVQCYSMYSVFSVFSVCSVYIVCSVYSVYNMYSVYSVYTIYSVCNVYSVNLLPAISASQES